MGICATSIFGDCANTVIPVMGTLEVVCLQVLSRLLTKKAWDTIYIWKPAMFARTGSCLCNRVCTYYGDNCIINNHWDISTI